jgi:hypothetical protein
VKLNPEQIKRGQCTRRKTLFPLSAKAVVRHQALLAYHLLHNCKLPVYACRQVLKCSPDRVRQLVAKAERIKRDLASKHQCTCPARYDHTVMGHLPD